MERTPTTAPLDCYGLELDAQDPQCQACPHMEGCFMAMGSRRYRTSLDKAVFDLVPRTYKAYRPPQPDQDPEITHIQMVYVACYQSIFAKKPKDSAQPYTDEIAANARRLKCSIRLYMLASMIGHVNHQNELIGHTDKASASPFTAKLLVHKRNSGFVQQYAEVCRHQFGTFTLSALDTINDTEYESSEIETVMLNSEIVAGSFIVNYKLFQGGPPEEKLYERHEIALDPHWLAVEPTYKSLVLSQGSQHGSRVQKDHRFSTIRTIKFLKSNPSVGIVVHLTRSNIMARAVSRVLGRFQLKPSDFEIKNEPVTNAFEMWKELSRAIQQNELLKYYYGGHSVFKPRRS